MINNNSPLAAIIMEVMETKELPINYAARNSVWLYPRATPPRFNGAPIIYETAHSHERPDIFSLPKGSDVTVELYGGAVVLQLEGELRRVHIRLSTDFTGNY